MSLAWIASITSGSVMTPSSDTANPQKQRPSFSPPDACGGTASPQHMSLYDGSDKLDVATRPLPASVTRADRQRMLDKYPLLKEAAEAWARRGEPEKEKSTKMTALGVV